MRLTLRTLLAWIDGVLAAPQQEELGAKVQASRMAPALVERIAEIVARPGLAAPRIDGRGLAEDANTCAEFLDNVLASDQLEAFERVCIDSDIHLAEVADCHALLAELARAPHTVEPLDRHLRRRLLERVAEQMAQPPVEQAHDEAALLVRAVKQAVDARGSRGKRAVVTAGKPRTKSGLAAWVSAGVAVFLLAVLVATLGWSLFGGGPAGRDVAVRPPVGESPAGESPSPRPPSDAAAAAPSSLPTDEPPLPGAVDRGDGDRPDPDQPAAPTAVAQPVPADPAAAAIGAALPLPVMEEADAPAEFAEPALAEPALPAAPPPGIVAEGGVVLHRVGAGGDLHWETLVAGDTLLTEESLLAPAHAFPRLLRGDVSIRLQPGTLAAVTTDADGIPRLEVIFGKAVVWTEAADAIVGVTAGGLCGVLGIGPRQLVGVQVELTRHDGDDPAVTPPGSRALLFVTGGSRLRQTESDGGPPGRPLTGLAAEQQLPPRQEVVWDSSEPAAARSQPATRSPDWLSRTAPVDRLDDAAGAALAAGLRADRPVADALQDLVADRRVENRIAAATTQALIGDYDDLVALLCEERSGDRLSERQWDDLQNATVPLALARGANAAAKLRKSFEARGPAGRGEELYDLARGEQAAESLVAALEDETLVVRRYAFQALVRRFPDDPAGRIEYRPDRPAALNDRGIDWWRRKVAAADGGPEPPAP